MSTSFLAIKNGNRWSKYHVLREPCKKNYTNMACYGKEKVDNEELGGSEEAGG